MRIVVLVLSLNVAGAIALAQQEEPTPPNTGTITGRVINDSGQPIAHATVTVYASGLSQPRFATTDDSGSFEVSGLDPLPYSVYASAPAHIMPPRDPDSPPATYRLGDSVTVSLIKGAVITGAVMSPSGEPLVQVGVRALLIRDANDKPPTSIRFPTERLTDDRGIYRIYGLPAGTYLVSAGGRGTYGSNPNAYESDSPTFAPSSSRDTAAEVLVRAGEETSGVDIRYRGEPGHIISGTVAGAVAPNETTNITLTQTFNGFPQVGAVAFQSQEARGFSFYGVADGEYDLTAQSYSTPSDGLASEPLHVTVKGSDVSGLHLTVKPLAAISGKVILESATAPDCANKRKPLLSETLVQARILKNAQPVRPAPASSTFSQSALNKSGDFTLRYLGAGQFNLNATFFAKYWYLRSIKRTSTMAAPSKTTAASRQTDIAREGISLKFGERVNGVTVTLTEGAASLHGAVKLSSGTSIPPKLYVHLVPAEKENAEDVLRFFTTPVAADGSFALNNLAPGKYWILARLSPDNEPEFDSKLRGPEAANQRGLLRRAAELAKTELEFRPCQNVAGYQLPFEISAPRN
jgi:carboxypeptidase family protein